MAVTDTIGNLIQYIITETIIVLYGLRALILIIPISASMSVILDRTLVICISKWNAPDLDDEFTYCKAPTSDLLAFKYNIFTGCMALICVLNIIFATIFTIKSLKVLKMSANLSVRQIKGQKSQPYKLKELILKNFVLTLLGCCSTLFGILSLCILYTFPESLRLLIYLHSANAAYYATSNAVFVSVNTKSLGIIESTTSNGLVLLSTTKLSESLVVVLRIIDVLKNSPFCVSYAFYPAVILFRAPSANDGGVLSARSIYPK